MPTPAVKESVSNFVLRGPFLWLLLIAAGELECFAMSARTVLLVSEFKAQTLLLNAIDARVGSKRRLLAGRLLLKVGLDEILEYISLSIGSLLDDI